MASSPCEGLRQAKADVLAITRSRARRITARGRPLARMVFEGLPKVFAVVGDSDRGGHLDAPSGRTAVLARRRGIGVGVAGGASSPTRPQAMSPCPTLMVECMEKQVSQ